MIELFHSDHIPLRLPEKHRFPFSKYALIKKALIERSVFDESQFTPAPLASVDDLLLAHSKSYVEEIRTGKIDRQKMRRIGFPWAPELFDRARSSVGGFWKAIEWSQKHGVSGHLAGGTHHAHADFGEGFCVFNDFAVGAFKLWTLDPEERVAIIDLDVHQGNGNSSILAGDQRAFVASIHAEKNFPFRKTPGDYDVEVPISCSDKNYLGEVASLLSRVKEFAPSQIFYQAGVDALIHDKLGTLNLSYECLRERDRMVFEFAGHASIPIAVALGGGYADPIELSVEAYIQTYEELVRVFTRRQK